MAPDIAGDKSKDSHAAAVSGLHPTRSFGISTEGWLTMAAVAGPIAMALLLVPWRGQLDTGDDALFLVLVIVAVASSGRRLSAAIAALVSALAFDFFLTVPYYSFRISNRDQLITELLLLVVGLAVGQLAARGRLHRHQAIESRDEVVLLHSLTELASSGEEPRVVIDTALDELQQLLYLRDCHFTRRYPGRIAARITPQGDLTLGDETWPTQDLGLPTRKVDLPVRGNGWLLGHFLLTPTPGRPVPHHRLLVAVAVADQVGTALATDESATPVAGPEGRLLTFDPADDPMHSHHG
jgi:hypothetical protein